MSEADWIEDEKTVDSADAMFQEVFGDKGFDASKPDSNLLPPGIYRLRVSGSQKKKSKATETEYIAMTFVVSEPESLSGKRHYENFNFKHADKRVREIAERNFKGLCRACGVLNPKKFSELIDKEFIVTIAIEPDKKTNQLRNNIKTWHDASREVPAVFVEAAGGDGGEAFGM